MRGRAEVARKAHNLEVVGSIPTPATKKIKKYLVNIKTHRIFVKEIRNNIKLKKMNTVMNIAYYYEGEGRNAVRLMAMS